MRVYPDQLSRHLNQLFPCYLIFGDDPWLIETTKDQIRQFAKRQGFDEKSNSFKRRALIGTT